MRKFLFAFSAVVLLAGISTSCQKAEDPQQKKDEPQSKSVIKATIVDNGTKVTYSEDGSHALNPKWHADDIIIGFDGAGETYGFSIKSGGGSATATFEIITSGGYAGSKTELPAVGTKMYMFYAPGKTPSNISSSSLTVSIASQGKDKVNENDNDVPALMMASGEIVGTETDKSLSLQFYNQTAIIGIKNPTIPSASSVKSISLSGSGINTDVIFSLNSGSLQASYSNPGTITKTVSGSTVASSTTYIVVCPTTSIVDLTFTTDTDASFSKTGKQIVAGNYYYMTPTFKKHIESVQLWENGPYWATCNIGAESETDYGWYFAWGYTEGCVRNSAGDGWVLASDGTTGKEFNTTYFDNRGSGKFKDAATDNWGDPWRLPTNVEFNSLFSNVTGLRVA